MSDNKRSVWSWLNLATAGIRFGPDREEVYRELREHIEDKTADFQRIFPDMTENEARDRAVAGMGDPEEIGKELAKVHRPWLGYLWVASRWLARIALVLSAVALLFWGGTRHDLEYLLAWGKENREKQAYSDALYGGQPQLKGERVALYDLDGETRLGRCTISAHRAVLWRGTDGSDTLFINLRLDYDRPWESQEMALYSLWAEDDLGNRYTANDFSAGWPWGGLGWVETDVRLENVPENAREVRIHYLPGTDLDLALDLRREERP